MTARPPVPGTLSPMTTDPLPAPVVFNCTHREILVSAGGELRPLPRGPLPSIVDSLEAGETLECSLDLDGSARYTLSFAPGRAELALMLPDPLPGVWFLVEPEVLLRLPHRHDLCTPSRYQMEITGDEGARSHQSFLVGVHTSLDIARAEISTITPQQLDAADEAEGAGP